jgi:hypothetical protein
MGRKILGTGLVLFLVIVFMGLAFITGGGRASCAAAVASASTAAEHPPVGAYSGQQLANAALIMNAGAALGVSLRGQTIAVMTAMGESSLVNITYGDTAGPDSRGLFQQRDTWGTLAERMNPSTAAGFFFARLVKVPNWDTMAPTAAAHAVQRNADPNHYALYFDTATTVVAALTGGGDAACAAGAVGGNAQQLAQGLVAKINAGKITGLSPDHLREIRWIADGEVRPNCGIDTRVLQIITIATNTFDSIGISDINRACTGQRPGAGASSAHVVNGGGHAVDFYSFDRVPTTGAEPNAIKLLRALDPVMADGSGFGQSNCRRNAGTSIPLNTREFSDTCNHFHVQVDPNGAQPMKVGN